MILLIMNVNLDVLKIVNLVIHLTFVIFVYQDLNWM